MKEGIFMLHTRCEKEKKVTGGISNVVLVKIGLNIQPNSQTINNFVNQSTDYSIDLLIKTSNIKMSNFSSN